MREPLLPFAIEPMQPPDIEAVVAVEQAAYQNWSPRPYLQELTQNKQAHYFVLRLIGNSPASPEDIRIIGLIGFWLIADEAHIITIAIDPPWQGLGLGEWLLLFIIEQGRRLRATVMTLEVRLSNHVARALYHKYQFAIVGRRPNYYPTNSEDALILTTPPLAQPTYQALLSRRKRELLARLAQVDVDSIRQNDDHEIC